MALRGAGAGPLAPAPGRRRCGARGGAEDAHRRRARYSDGHETRSRHHARRERRRTSGRAALAAALCRIYARRGYRGGAVQGAEHGPELGRDGRRGDEMGRAQVYQAAAAGVEPTVDMNPVLLKPDVPWRGPGRGDGPAGRRDAGGGPTRPIGASSGRSVTAALGRLRSANDLVVIEGAGSSAEINLRGGDIVNMRVARHARGRRSCSWATSIAAVCSPALLGHVELFTAPRSVELVRGFVVNKFRGDAAQLDAGFGCSSERTGMPTLGVRAYLEGWRGDEEDSVALDRGRGGHRAAARPCASPSCACRTSATRPTSRRSPPNRTSAVEYVCEAARAGGGGGDRAARHQEHGRRPRLAARPRPRCGAGVRPPPAHRSWASAAATRCSAAASSIPASSNRAAAETPASACSTSRTVFTAAKRTVRVRASS